MTIREEFETQAKRYNWQLTRSPYKYYQAAHVEYAWMGFCMARGVSHLEEHDGH
jgi:hypothetical protein